MSKAVVWLGTKLGLFTQWLLTMCLSFALGKVYGIVVAKLIMAFLTGVISKTAMEIMLVLAFTIYMGGLVLLVLYSAYLGFTFVRKFQQRRSNV